MVHMGFIFILFLLFSLFCFVLSIFCVFVFGFLVFFFSCNCIRYCVCEEANPKGLLPIYWTVYSLSFFEFSVLILQVFPYGSVPLKTYLLDGDIDLTALCSSNVEEALASDVHAVLKGEEQNENAEFEVKDIQFITAEVFYPHWCFIIKVYS